MYTIKSKLQKVSIEKLRPTQMTVGRKEVESKREEWAKLDKKERRAAMEELFFPAVLGPGEAYYILDHHHAAVALLKEGTAEVQVGVAEDLSALGMRDFWVYMDHVSWVHPYDHRGRRCSFKEMPSSLRELRDDPYRSLAGEVRDRGGFAKSATPFPEFLWTNYFRENVPAGRLKSQYEKALKQAMRLAVSSKTAHLPGWAGNKR